MAHARVTFSGYGLANLAAESPVFLDMSRAWPESDRLDGLDVPEVPDVIPWSADEVERAAKHDIVYPELLGPVELKRSHAYRRGMYLEMQIDCSDAGRARQRRLAENCAIPPSLVAERVRQADGTPGAYTQPPMCGMLRLIDGLPVRAVDRNKRDLGLTVAAAFSRSFIAEHDGAEAVADLDHLHELVFNTTTGLSNPLFKLAPNSRGEKSHTLSTAKVEQGAGYVAPTSHPLDTVPGGPQWRVDFLSTAARIAKRALKLAVTAAEFEQMLAQSEVAILSSYGEHGLPWTSMQVNDPEFGAGLSAIGPFTQGNIHVDGGDSELFLTVFIVLFPKLKNFCRGRFLLALLGLEYPFEEDAAVMLFNGRKPHCGTPYFADQHPQRGGLQPEHLAALPSKGRNGIVLYIKKSVVEGLARPRIAGDVGFGDRDNNRQGYNLPKMFDRNAYLSMGGSAPLAEFLYKQEAARRFEHDSHFQATCGEYACMPTSLNAYLPPSDQNFYDHLTGAPFTIGRFSLEPGTDAGAITAVRQRAAGTLTIFHRLFVSIDSSKRKRQNIENAKSPLQPDINWRYAPSFSPSGLDLVSGLSSRVGREALGLGDDDEDDDDNDERRAAHAARSDGSDGSEAGPARRRGPTTQVVALGPTHRVLSDVVPPRAGRSGRPSSGIVAELGTTLSRSIAERRRTPRVSFEIVLPQQQRKRTRAEADDGAPEPAAVAKDAQGGKRRKAHEVADDRNKPILQDLLAVSSGADQPCSLTKDNALHKLCLGLCSSETVSLIEQNRTKTKAPPAPTASQLGERRLGARTAFVELRSSIEAAPVCVSPDAPLAILSPALKAAVHSWHTHATVVDWLAVESLAACADHIALELALGDWILDQLAPFCDALASFVTDAIRRARDGRPGRAALAVELNELALDLGCVPEAWRSIVDAALECAEQTARLPSGAVAPAAAHVRLLTEPMAAALGLNAALLPVHLELGLPGKRRLDCAASAPAFGATLSSFMCRIVVSLVIRPPAASASLTSTAIDLPQVGTDDFITRIFFAFFVIDSLETVDILASPAFQQAYARNARSILATSSVSTFTLLSHDLLATPSRATQIRRPLERLLNEMLAIDPDLRLAHSLHAAQLEHLAGRETHVRRVVTPRLPNVALEHERLPKRDGLAILGAIIGYAVARAVPHFGQVPIDDVVLARLALGHPPPPKSKTRHAPAADLVDDHLLALRNTSARMPKLEAYIGSAPDLGAAAQCQQICVAGLQGACVITGYWSRVPADLDDWLELVKERDAQNRQFELSVERRMAKGKRPRTGTGRGGRLSEATYIAQAAQQVARGEQVSYRAAFCPGVWGQHNDHIGAPKVLVGADGQPTGELDLAKYRRLFSSDTVNAFAAAIAAAPADGLPGWSEQLAVVHGLGVGGLGSGLSPMHCVHDMAYLGLCSMATARDMAKHILAQGNRGKGAFVGLEIMCLVDPLTTEDQLTGTLERICSTVDDALEARGLGAAQVEDLHRRGIIGASVLEHVPCKVKRYTKRIPALAELVTQAHNILERCDLAKELYQRLEQTI